MWTDLGAILMYLLLPVKLRDLLRSTPTGGARALSMLVAEECTPATRPVSATPMLSLLGPPPIFMIRFLHIGDRGLMKKPLWVRRCRTVHGAVTFP